MVERNQPMLINSSKIPVDGIGGLGMVALAGVMALAFPEARLILGGGFVCGIALAAAMIAMRRRTRSDGAGGGSSILFGESVVPAPRPDGDGQAPGVPPVTPKIRSAGPLYPNPVALS